MSKSTCLFFASLLIRKEKQGNSSCSWPGICGVRINLAGPLPWAVVSMIRTVQVLFEEGILRSGTGFGVATNPAEAMLDVFDGGPTTKYSGDGLLEPGSSSSRM